MQRPGCFQQPNVYDFMKEECVFRYVLLSLIPGLGPVSQKRLLQCCGGIEHCFEAAAEEILLIDRKESPCCSVGASRIAAFVNYREDPAYRQRAEQILRQCEESGVDVITASDKQYPNRFRSLDDMPAVVFAKGDLRINEYTKSLGIVGARRCTCEGKQAAIDLSEAAVAEGAAVISGLAKGIDAYAHTAAIKSDGYTIAVMGNGPDICYPREHQTLFEAIVRTGAIVSEYPPGTEAQNYRFPVRNRLIAALSDQVVVIDAGRRSGTESTVRYCRKYGKDLIRSGNDQSKWVIADRLVSVK